MSRKILLPKLWNIAVNSASNASALGVYIIPDQQYDMYQDTLQPILDTYNDTNFIIF